MKRAWQNNTKGDDYRQASSTREFSLLKKTMPYPSDIQQLIKI